MQLNKYKNLLFDKIKKQISDWFDSESINEIPNEEVYRFLHSIKGTAGTIELGGLYQMATTLLESIEEDKVYWLKVELRDYLYELMNFVYEYEHFEELEEKAKPQRDGDVPLVQVIDDDISMLILLKDVLEEKGWMVLASSDSSKAISQYFEFHPEAIILDVNMPNKDGFQYLNDLEMHTTKHFVPKIMISAKNDRVTRINAFRSGADDFIEKPIDVEEFIVRIERQIQRKRLFDESVLTDEMTNVYNRRYLNEALNRNLKDLKRTKESFSVALLDLDYFKQINDTYGHLVGDRILIAFAEFLKENTRSSDTVFRYGGEEFVILMPRTKEADAKLLMTRLLHDFSLEIFQHEEESFQITFSAGVYEVKSHEIAADDALKTADEALYKAKKNGRATVETVNQDIQGDARKKLFVSVIDDDAIIRTMLMKVLQNIDITNMELDVKVFEDGLAFLKSNRLDEEGEHFLILDGVMPIMDGLEVLQKVRKLEIQRQLYVLMLTGRRGEMDIARALRLGADDYVTKPFSITELQARIQRLIQRMN